jgi:hypothetical protein
VVKNTVTYASLGKDKYSRINYFKSPSTNEGKIDWASLGLVLLLHFNSDSRSDLSVLRIVFSINEYASQF